MNYGDILRRALSISWRHKYLWLLALLAGEGGAWSFSQSQGRPGHGFQGYNGHAGQAPDMSQVNAWVGTHAGLIAAIVAAAVLIVIVLFLLSTVALGAVIRGAAEHDEEREIGLGRAWAAGLGSFGPVLRLKLLAFAVVILSGTVVAGLVLAAVGAGTSGAKALAVGIGLLAALAVVVAIPFAIVLSVLLPLAARAIVLDGQSAFGGVRSAIALMRRRTGRVALVWVLAIVAGVVGGVALAFTGLVSGLPLAAVVAFTYFAGGLSSAVAIGVVLGAVWLAVLLAASGAVSAYISTLWTLAYRRFDEEPAPAINTAPLPA